MRTIPAGLVPVIEAAQNSPVELYELYLDVGTRYFASHDSDVVFAGIQYKALPIRRQPIETKMSLEIDGVSSGLTDVKQELSQLLTTVDFRGRRCRIIKVFLEALTNPANYIVIFDGRMDTPSISEDSTFGIRVLSYLDLLHRDFPARLFSTVCNYKLGNEWCTVDMTTAANKQTGTAASGSTTNKIVSSVLTQVDDYWKIGRVKFLSGANKGQAREIFTSKLTGTLVLVRMPFAFTPAIGDQVEFLRGCNKTEDDCVNKFDNWVNYGGFNSIPKPSIPLSGLSLGGSGGGKGGGKGGGGK